MPQVTCRASRVLLLIFAALSVGSARDAAAQGSPAADFEQNCASCHSIGGGPLIGPDLRDVSSRRDRAWLEKFVSDPEGMVASGDAVAQKLAQEAGPVQMPNATGMTPARVKALLDYIDQASGKEPPASASAPMILGPEDEDRGRRLFLGSEKLSAGGPSCISCHAVAGLLVPGGGTLGPDLTDVFSRLGAERGLAAWLAAPPTPTMRPAFQNATLTQDETLAFVAFFRSTSRGGGAQAASAQLAFLIAGCIAAGAGLVLLNFVWRNRFTAVRAPLARGDL